jgi:nicotinamidase-related amidase
MNRNEPSGDKPADEGALPRCPELMNADETALLVVDAQEKLLAVVPGSARVVWNIRRLLDAAAVLGVPRAATEQYPEKLGPTAAVLAERIESTESKLAFSGAGCGPCCVDWKEAGIYRVLVCGIETHVCIQQTAFDLLAWGYQVYVAVDAVTTRHAIDHDTALRRMESGGIVLTTTEAAMFEWCREAGTPEFKKISELAKESPP